MSSSFNVLNRRCIPDPPVNLLLIVGKDFNKSSSPTSISYNAYSGIILHGWIDRWLCDGVDRVDKVDKVVTLTANC